MLRNFYYLQLVKTFKITHDEEDVQAAVHLILVPDRPINPTFVERQ